MSDEQLLQGGTHGPVIRLGDTVRRQGRGSTNAVFALLQHLERAGFDGAPRALGIDAEGREILSHIPGEVVGQRGSGPLPACARSDGSLVRVARPLRRLHDATVDIALPPDARWEFQVGAPRSGAVICHNDIGPWNTVFV